MDVVRDVLVAFDGAQLGFRPNLDDGSEPTTRDADSKLPGSLRENVEDNVDSAGGSVDADGNGLAIGPASGAEADRDTIDALRKLTGSPSGSPVPSSRGARRRVPPNDGAWGTGLVERGRHDRREGRPPDPMSAAVRTPVVGAISIGLAAHLRKE